MVQHTFSAVRSAAATEFRTGTTRSSANSNESASSESLGGNQWPEHKIGIRYDKSSIQDSWMSIDQMMGDVAVTAFYHPESAASSGQSRANCE